MSNRTGVRVWRYRGGMLRYRTSSHRRESQDLDLDKAQLFLDEREALAEDDWVIQRLPASRINDKVASIPRAEILAVISDKKIPADGDVWHFDGAGLHRIYRRSVSPDASARRAEVTGAISGDGPQIIFYRNDLKPMVYHLDTKEWENVELICDELTLDANGPGPSTVNDLLDDEDRLLVTLARRIASCGAQTITDLAKGYVNGDEETVRQLTAKVVSEVLMGAAPAPVQGHSVLHQIPAILDTIKKIDDVRSGRFTAEQVSSGSAPTLTGGFGSGVASVESTWAAVGSVLSLIKDSVGMLRTFLDHDEAERRAYSGANARSRAVLSVATHGVKSAQTIATAVDAVRTVQGFATLVPSSFAPITGAVTGTLATIRASVQAEKSRRRMVRLRKLLEQNRAPGEEAAEPEDGEGPPPTREVLHPDVEKLLGYGMRKASRKFRFKTGEATVAAFGAASSAILIVGAVVAGANAWNPVGWGIGVAVAIAGAGLLTYRIWRKATSARRAAKRGFSRADFPQMLIDAFLRFFRLDAQSVNTVVLFEILEAYGVKALNLLTAPENAALAKARIARHLNVS